MKSIIVLACLAVLGGCASTPPSQGTAEEQAENQKRHDLQNDRDMSSRSAGGYFGGPKTD